LVLYFNDKVTKSKYNWFLWKFDISLVRNIIYINVLTLKTIKLTFSFSVLKYLFYSFIEKSYFSIVIWKSTKITNHLLKLKLSKNKGGLSENIQLFFCPNNNLSPTVNFINILPHSFYARISQKRKKDLLLDCHFYAFGICTRKICA